MSGTFLSDLGERVARAFVNGFLAALPVGVTFTDWGQLKVAGVAALTGGVTASLSLLVGLVARRFGSPDDASFMSRGGADA